MTTPDLQPIADAVLRLARRQGFVQPRDVRTELRLAGQAEELWPNVMALIQPDLVRERGRYYWKDSFSPRLRKEHIQKRAIEKVIRRLIRQHRQRAKGDERRGQTRIDFIQPVKIHAEDGNEYTLMSRDLSTTGIRLLGTQRLLGQRVQLDLAADDSAAPCRLIARILWTCAIGDDLFENGGSFVELLA